MPNNAGGHDTKKDPASVFGVSQSKDPDACHARLDGLSPIDLGEHAVGSEDEIVVRSPRNVDGQAASAELSVVGPVFEVDWANRGYDAGQREGAPFVFKFKPLAAGPYHGALKLYVRWLDGTVETHTIQVTGRARALDAAPASGNRGKSPIAHSDPKSPKPAADTASTEDSKTSRDIVGSAHALLMREQHEGINDVSREASKFKPQPAPKELWQVLVDLAIQVGTAQLAALASRFVSERIARVLFKAEAAEAKALTEALDRKYARESEQNAVEGPVFTGPSWSTSQDMAKDARTSQTVASGALTAAFSSVLINAASTFTAHGAAVDESQASGSSGEKELGASRDGEIAFFSAQRSIHNQMWHATAKEVIKMTGEVMKTQPKLGGMILEGMADGITALADGGMAKQAQADATSAEFAAYMARTKLGTADVRTATGSQTVTNLEKQRTFDNENKLATPSLAAGVLEIEVDRDPGSGNVSVTGARMNGVSWLTTSRLQSMDLRKVGVPVRISVFHGASIITVDEANRVRVGGLPLTKRNAGGEAHDIQEAERIAQMALSKPLASWGVEIQTNDAGQPHATGEQHP